MRTQIIQELNDSAALKQKVAELLADKIEIAVTKVVEAYRNGKKLILAGNGGSAADAQHIAAEFVVRYKMERRRLPAIALNTDTSVLTATGNDYSYDQIFSRQMEGHGQTGDVFIAITTSGNSPNILRAVEMAKKIGVYTIGLTGKGGGKLKDIVDLAIVIPSDATERIQESHITIGHIISNLAERELFKG